MQRKNRDVARIQRAKDCVDRSPALQGFAVLANGVRQHRVDHVADEAFLGLRQAAALFELLLQFGCRPGLPKAVSVALPLLAVFGRSVAFPEKSSFVRRTSGRRSVASLTIA